jgi:hypothetical protein
MKSIENSIYTMQSDSLNLLDTNEPKMLVFSIYPALKAKFATGFDLAYGLRKEQDVQMQITSTAKSEARALCTEYILDLGSKNMSYAQNTGNKAMYDTVKITRSKLNTCSYNAFVVIVDNQLTFTEDHLADMADWSVTTQTVNDGRKLLANLNKEIADFAARNIKLKQITGRLGKQLRNNNKVLVIIDGLVESMRVSDPDFVDQYTNARNIHYFVNVKVAFKAKVYDAVTRQPLPGAILTITPVEGPKALRSGADLVKTVKVRSAGGGIQLKSMPAGNYIVTVSYYGYNDYQVQVSVNEGILTVVDLPVSKTE